MPRPSLETVRVNQILDSFEHCIVKYGLEGSTLEKIAQEGGMKRSILRHYVGNREDLLKALVSRLERNSLDQIFELENWLPESNRIDYLIRSLFSEKRTQNENREELVTQILIFSANQFPWISETLRSLIDSFVEFVSKELQREFTSANTNQVWSVASGVVALYFNHSAFSNMEMTSQYFAANVQNVQTLINSLR